MLLSKQDQYRIILSLLDPAMSESDLDEIVTNMVLQIESFDAPDCDPIDLIDENAPRLWDYYDRAVVQKALDEISGVKKLKSIFVFLPLNPNTPKYLIDQASGGIFRNQMKSAFCMYNPTAIEQVLEVGDYAFLGDATFIPWFIKWRMTQDRLTIFQALEPVWNWWLSERFHDEPDARKARYLAQTMKSNPTMNFVDSDDLNPTLRYFLFSYPDGLMYLGSKDSKSAYIKNASCLGEIFGSANPDLSPISADEKLEILVGTYRAFDEVRKRLGIPEKPNALLSLL